MTKSNKRLVVAFFFLTLFIVSSFVYLGIRDRYAATISWHETLGPDPCLAVAGPRQSWGGAFTCGLKAAQNMWPAQSHHTTVARLRHITYERQCDTLYK